MKFETREQVFEVGDNWYQRTIRLREAFEDESKHVVYRFKAWVLFLRMYMRVQEIIALASELTKVKVPTNVEKGVPDL